MYSDFTAKENRLDELRRGERTADTAAKLVDLENEMKLYEIAWILRGKSAKIVPNFYDLTKRAFINKLVDLDGLKFALTRDVPFMLLTDIKAKNTIKAFVQKKDEEAKSAAAAASVSAPDDEVVVDEVIVYDDSDDLNMRLLADTAFLRYAPITYDFVKTLIVPTWEQASKMNAFSTSADVSTTNIVDVAHYLVLLARNPYALTLSPLLKQSARKAMIRLHSMPLERTWNALESVIKSWIALPYREKGFFTQVLLDIVDLFLFCKSEISPPILPSVLERKKEEKLRKIIQEGSQRIPEFRTDQAPLPLHFDAIMAE